MLLLEATKGSPLLLLAPWKALSGASLISEVLQLSELHQWLDASRGICLGPYAACAVMCTQNATEQHLFITTSLRSYSVLLLFLLLLLLQVRYAEDQDFFYAQYASLYAHLANLGYRNNEIVTVTGTNRRRRARVATDN
jgi:hypothetical protein